MRQFSLNQLNYVVLPAYGYDCCLETSGVVLDNMQMIRD